MDPKKVRDAVRDTMWVIAAAFFLFPLVAMIFLGFNLAYIFLFMLAFMFFLVGLMANGSGIA